MWIRRHWRPILAVGLTVLAALAYAGWRTFGVPEANYEAPHAILFESTLYLRATEAEGTADEGCLGSAALKDRASWPLYEIGHLSRESVGPEGEYVEVLGGAGSPSVLAVALTVPDKDGYVNDGLLFVMGDDCYFHYQVAPG